MAENSLQLRLAKAEADRDANAQSRLFHIQRADQWRAKYFRLLEKGCISLDALKASQPFLSQLREHESNGINGPSLDLVNAQTEVQTAIDLFSQD